MPSSAQNLPANGRGGERRAYVALLAMFLIQYMGDGTVGYLMIYLKSIDYSTLQMALLTSAAALVSMAVQPYIGHVADHAPTRNGVLVVALCICGVLVPMLLVSKVFWYILIVYTAYLSVRSVLHPLTDTIALEYTAKHRLSFGPIRTMGCVGYAAMMAIAGLMAERNPGSPFLLYTVTAGLLILVLRFVPVSRGVKPDTAKRANPLMIFQNRTLLKFTLLAVAFSITKSFYHTYFSVYFTADLGGATNMYGFLVSIAALTEIPLILSLDKLVGRFGVRRVLLVAGCVDTLRWLLTALIRDPMAQLGIHALLGTNNMVVGVTMVMFVNQCMPPEKKVTGQATYVMVTSIGSLLIGNLLGGVFSNYVGFRPVFFACVAINVVAMLAFVLSRNPPVTEEIR